MLQIEDPAVALEFDVALAYRARLDAWHDARRDDIFASLFIAVMHLV